MFRHEKYAVGRKSVDFAVSVAKVSGGFPENGKYGLTNQIRRAAVSISSNVAKGRGRNSDEDFTRFLGMA